ncbi:MAG: hypothetical protein PWQ25_1345 [Deferribacteres bacterium]|jgi:hypothetical protein|nr:hypothetical protein [Deferribacteres bacterium]
MIVAKLRALYDNDIRTYYGNILKKGEQEIVVNIKTKDIDGEYSKIWITFSNNNQTNVFEAGSVEVGNDMIILRDLRRLDADSEREFNRIDYKGIFKIKKVEKGEKRKYINLIENTISESKSSLVKKVKSIIPSEPLNNQLILKFLLEMNNKIDNILELLKNNEIIAELTTVNAIDISGGGLSFFSKEIFEEEDLIYVESDIAESYHRIRISVLCKIVSIIKTSKGFIYGANYEKIDKDLREEIIRFIFEKEREIIKGSKS